MIWAVALAASPADWTKLPASVKPAVEDTYIDQTTADANYGRSEVLISGLGKVILIRPTNLSLMVPDGAKISGASLVFTTSEPVSPEIIDIGLIKAPWFEGPGRAPGLVVAAGEARWAATWNNSRAGDGGARWDRAGAVSDADRELISGLQTTFEPGAFKIDGLGPALQKMLDNPGKYTGICFTTKGRAQFLSSEFGTLGPVFHLQTEAVTRADGPDLDVIEISPSAPMRSAFPGEGQPMSWEAKVRNVGSQASAATTGEWTSRYSTATTASIPALKPGEETVVKLDHAFKDQADKRYWPLSFRAELAGDVSPRNNFAEIAVGAIPVAVVEGGQPASPEAQAGFRRLVELMNTHVLPMSRFGFAPEGVSERVRYVSDTSRAMAVVEVSALDAAPIRALTQSILGYPAAFFDRPIVDPTASTSFLALSPDTRDEWGYLGGVSYPERLWPPRLLGQGVMPESGLLGRSEAALLMTLAGKSGTDRSPTKIPVSNIVILHAYDGAGRPISKAKVTLYQPKDGALGTPIFTGTTSTSGAVLVSARSFADKRESFYGPLSLDGSNAWIFAEFESQGEKATRWIPWVQLVEEAKRGGFGASSFEYRMLLSDQPVDRTQNLVKGKALEDSASRFPAALGAVIDEDLKTAIELPGEPAWIEIDLGRDRAIGEVQIVFAGEAAWDSFAIQVYNTSQQPDAARMWIDEAYGPMRAEVQGQPKDGMVRLRYVGGNTNARYLRILKRKGSAKLAEVIVYPVAGG